MLMSGRIIPIRYFGEGMEIFKIWATTHSLVFWQCLGTVMGFPGGSEVKVSACDVGDLGLIPGSRRFPWRRKWQPTPVFLPRESHGWRSLMGYSFTWSQRVGHDWATSLSLSLWIVMVPLGVSFHLLIEDQGLVLSAILVPFDLIGLCGLCCVLGLCYSFRSCALPLSLLLHKIVA